MAEDDNRGWVTAEYSLLPSATNTRVKREREKVSGRTHEIQRLIGRSLRACVDLSKMPDLTITIDADVIQADGGTRTASITGGFVALEMCIKNAIKNEGMKYCECENGYVLQGDNCVKIGEMIGYCNENEGMTSTGCDEGYFLENGKCISCNVNYACVKCSQRDVCDE